MQIQRKQTHRIQIHRNQQYRKQQHSILRKWLNQGLLMVLMIGFCINPLSQGASYAKGSQFSDVKEADWFKGDLDYIINDSRKILAGYPDGTYKPKGTLQVDQFLKCVVIATGHNVEPSEGYWAQSYIDKAIEEGYINSSDYNDYKKAITRAEMASIVSKVMEDLEVVTYEKLETIEKSLIDSKSVASIHIQNVCKVYELGIITGYPDGTFKPMNTLTRAEATVVLRRIIDTSARKPYTSVEDPYVSHYKGGTDWVDPVTGSDEVSVPEDLMMIHSEKLFYDDEGALYDQDYLSVIAKYGEEEYPADQLEDLRRLLSRRLSQENVVIIMDYVDDKTGWYEFLPQKEKWFYMEGYEIRVIDRIGGEGKPYQSSSSVEIQAWYR